MANIPEFILPEYLQNSETERIHATMLEQLPSGMDKTEGGIPWDLTRPTALVNSETVEFVITEVLKNMFPMWAYDEMLDYHGQSRGIVRKAAQKAGGFVTFTGTVDYTIQAGTRVTTTSDIATPTIVFDTVANGTIGAAGTTNIEVIAVEEGVDGNVAIGKIDRLDIPDENITAVTNSAAMSGGINIEEDDDYRQRLIDYDQSQGEAYIGSIADYKRWAMSVNGVGDATIVPASDDTGKVTIVLTDVDGKPASTALCNAVYEYIMRDSSPAERLAPVNALLAVVSPTTQTISISAKIELSGAKALATVKESFIDMLNQYYPTALDDGEVRYAMIGSLLINIDGVEDYTQLKLNGGTENITVTEDTLPESDSESVVLTE